ncbi:MAG: S1 RNA-binding domain-containing protein [Patescibacteria group bacterium]
MNKKTSKSKEPTSMEELLLLSNSKVKGFSKAEKVKGIVAAKNPKSLILDIGGKSEGVVAENAFIEARDLIKTLEIGDEVNAIVLIPETKEGTVLLSLRHAANDAIWEKLEKHFKNKKEISVKGKSASRAGIMVEVEGIYGFIPASQVAKKYSDLDELVEKSFKAIIIDLNRRNNKIVLSEKEVSEAGEIKLNKEALEKVKEGEIYEGKVITITNFGCFVRLDIDKKVEVEGLVHISEIAWEKVRKVTDILKEGDKVKVKVLEVRDGRLSLSIKHAQKDPWDDIAKKYKQEQKIKGSVTKVSDFGIFVQIEPGVEGLVHITKIPPATKFNIGDKVNCYIEEVDSKEKRISLGITLTAKPINYK